MKTKQDIQLKIQALKDMRSDKKTQDTISQAIISGEIQALEWVLVNSK